MTTKPIKIEVRGEAAKAHGPFPMEFLRVIAALPGRKRWQGSAWVQFEFNRAAKAALDQFPGHIAWEDLSGELSAVEVMDNMPTQAAPPPLPPMSNYEPKRTPMAHQTTALALSHDRTAYAYLLEMGLGKTYVAITNAGMLYADGKISGMLVIAPKGVHRQWVNEELPKHLDERVPINAFVWNGAKPPTDQWRDDCFNVLAMNVDSVRTEKGYQTAHDFLTRFAGRTMMVMDEGHNIKNFSAKRTKLIIALGRLARYRRLLTGTPISKNLVDAWSQFMFLDPRILGHKYMTSFRARYCQMGGFEGKQIIGHKNVEEFYSLIAPHAYRLTKIEALDLPPKQYIIREYDMSPKTAKHYRELKNTFMTQLGEELVDVKTAATAMLRLQQIVCGYLPNEAGEPITISDERVAETLEICRQTEGPVVIWARFKEDIHRLIHALEREFGAGCAVDYYGGTSDKQRSANVEEWRAGRARFFVSNPAAGGTGLNLQGECQTVIYYSNSFDALHRWQSEDRTHRMGMGGAVTYYDLVANKSVDRAVLANLRRKKSMSDLTLDEIRQALSG